MSAEHGIPKGGVRLLDDLKIQKSSLSRRSLVRRIGMGGLMAAAVVTMGEQRASAAVAPNYDYFCCQLAFAPHFPYSDCSNGAAYIWGCYSGAQFCTCCEKGYPNYTMSSIHCGP